MTHLVFSILTCLALCFACNSSRETISDSPVKSTSAPAPRVSPIHKESDAGVPLDPNSRDLATFVGPWVNAPGLHVQEVLSVMQKADREAYNALLMSRATYESRCGLLIKRNSEGWLERKMSKRDARTDRAIESCSMMQTDSLALVWLEGGDIRGPQPECADIEVIKPFRALVKSAGELFRIRIDSGRDRRDGSYLLSHAECGATSPSSLACNKFEFFMQQDPTVSFHALTCHDTLRRESEDTSGAAIKCLEHAQTLAEARLCWGQREISPDRRQSPRR